MKCVIYILIMCFSNTNSANILLIGPMASYGHFTIVFQLAKELAARNHQVTVINPYPQKTPINNYRDVSVEDVDIYLKKSNQNLLNLFRYKVSWTACSDMVLGISELTLKNKNVRALLNSNETFDVVILESFLEETLAGVAYHFKAPLILLSPLISNIKNNYLFANPAPSSYVPNLFGTLTKQMNFWERLSNVLRNTIMDLVRELYSLPRHRVLFKKYIESDIKLDDILYNISLMLTNSHVSVTDVVPRVPSIVEIGGFHINPPKSLPEDLKKFLDDSKDGVVLFAMGSNLKSKDLKSREQSSILRAFSKIKQHVLWKFEGEITDCPKNVKIMKWVPQQDVLAHPNVKAFISHGGLLSIIETVYYGVPIIGIPVFADQNHNVASAVNDGYAISVPLHEINEEKFTWALNEILNNPQYRENVQKRSKLMRDQPLKPIESAVFSIEHVIRHKGAPHLRSTGLDLKWYQKEMVDILVFSSVMVVVAYFVVYYTLSHFLNVCCKRKGSEGKKVRH